MKIKQHRFYGSALKNSLLMAIIQNTKILKPATEIKDNNDTYKLDTDLTTRTIRIYYCQSKKHVIISHSSTIANTEELGQSVSDIADDLKLAFFGASSTTRYKNGVKVQAKAESKYIRLGYTITNVGYSLGAQIAVEMGKNSQFEDSTVVYNKPIVPFDLITGKDKKTESNTYQISTSNDITSALRPLQAKQPNEYVFKSNTLNPVNAHFNDQLGTLSDDIEFGRQGKGIDLSKYQSPINKLIGKTQKDKLTPTQKPVGNMDEKIWAHLNSGGTLNIKKLKVKELKTLVKQHRKRNVKQYPITNKSKQQLRNMLEQLLTQ